MKNLSSVEIRFKIKSVSKFDYKLSQCRKSIESQVSKIGSKSNQCQNSNEIKSVLKFDSKSSQCENSIQNQVGEN